MIALFPAPFGVHRLPLTNSNVFSNHVSTSTCHQYSLIAAPNNRCANPAGVPANILASAALSSAPGFAASTAATFVSAPAASITLAARSASSAASASSALNSDEDIPPLLPTHVTSVKLKLYA